MKIGTIASPWRYDATFNFAQLLLGGVREPPIGGGHCLLPLNALTTPMWLVLLASHDRHLDLDLFSAAQARARRPRQPADAATPSNYFLCRDPGAGFEPSCLGECAIAARHEPEHSTMWYRKNVGGLERAARLIGGSLMLICGVVALHASPLGLLLSGAGVVTLVIGVFGYCPACAIAGREPLKG